MGIPSGDAFLPEYTLEDLLWLYRREKDSEAKIRLLAAIYRKEGKGLGEIGYLLKYPPTTLGDWLRQMHKEGIHRRYNKKKQGRPKRLTDGQLNNLKSVVLNSPQAVGLFFVMWTTKLVQDYIEQIYNVPYSLRQVRNILHCMGFTCVKPRPRHRKASKKAQEEFKISFKDNIEEYVKNGFKVFFLDEATFPVKPYITYGWFQKGIKPVVKYLHRKKEKHRVLAALSKDHFFYQFTEENFNSDVFEKFLSSLIEKFGKVVIVMDQARYHTSYQMQTFYEQHEKHLHVVYFPSYSPELNPTEQVWRKVKRWLALILWTNKEELKDQLICAFESDLAMVPIYEYLLP